MATKEAGYVAVLRYLRNLTRAEAQAYLAAGLGVGTIFETAADEAALGAAVGASDGRVAASQAAVIGQPWGTLLVVNLADFAASPAQLPAIAAYFDAFRAEAAQYQTCGYGTAYVLEELAPARPGVVWWQNAEDDNGVPGSVVWPGAWLYQRTAPTLQIPGVGQSQYDEDLVIRAPNWWASTSIGDDDVRVIEDAAKTFIGLDGPAGVTALEPAEVGWANTAYGPTMTGMPNTLISRINAQIGAAVTTSLAPVLAELAELKAAVAAIPAAPPAAASLKGETATITFS